VHGTVEADTQAVIITADVDELKVFASSLDSAVARRIVLEPAPGDAATRQLLTLSLELNTTDAVIVSTHDDAATLKGSKRAFHRLADELRVFVEYNDLSLLGMHTHFEPGGRSNVGDWIVVAGDSAHLVITGPVFDEPKRPKATAPSD
jgi:hypothetical protein